MSTVFVSNDVWPSLTKAVRSCRQRCAVAVAYFGAGASRLLPLPKGSRLVVDASERAVAAGQTCPADLLTLLKRGVAIYTVPNLHAKVFVLGRAAYIGSPNVSRYSASQLVEALVQTTDTSVISAARKFIDQHCLHELTPTVLKHLQKLYRPPRFPGGRRNKRQPAAIAQRPTLPRILLAQLHLGEWSERDETLHDAGFAVAKKRRVHPRSFELDSFRNAGKCSYQRGDVVIQVLEQDNGRILVTSPGNVLHVRRRRDKNRQVSFVYVERPSRRRRSLKAVANQLGYGVRTRLERQGIVREASFAQALLSVWTK